MAFPWEMPHPLKHAISIGQEKTTTKKPMAFQWDMPSQKKNMALLTYHNNAMCYNFHVLLLINQHIHVN